MPVQVALIGKACGGGDLGQWGAGCDQAAGEVKAALDDIGMRSEARCAGEMADGLKAA